MTRQQNENGERAAHWQRMMDATEEYLQAPGRTLTPEQIWDQWSVVEECRLQRDYYLARVARDEGGR